MVIGIVSIVVVCLNEKEEKINRTLNSIFNQTYTDTEVIIVDGSSLPETLQVLRQYFSKFACFISEPDNGIYDAMNKGITNSHGEWLLFMNMGDEFSDNTTIERMINASSPADGIIYGDIIHKKFGYKHAPNRISKWVFYSSGICHQAILARRLVFDQVGLFNTGIGIAGDQDWLLRAYLNGFLFHYFRETVCIYEGDGFSANYKRQCEARSWILKSYYSKSERIIFGFMLFVLKLHRRIITGNFSIPVLFRSGKI